MDDILSRLTPWALPVTEQDKSQLMSCLMDSESWWTSSLFQDYLTRLLPYRESLGLVPGQRTREIDGLGSGLVFYYGCLVYCSHFPDWGQYIPDVFLYNLLYLLVDHYLDDKTVDPILKKQSIRYMWRLIDDPHLPEQETPPEKSLVTIAEVYRQLTERRPRCRQALSELFQLQIRSLSVQSNPNLSRELYHQLALDKGGLTMLVLTSIVESDDEQIIKATYNMGTIMQLIDDSVDVLRDRENHIYTIATHDLEQEGKLDRIWMEIGERILVIPPCFRLYLLLYVIFLFYLPDRNKSCYSDELQQRTTIYNIFDYHHGCDGSSLLTLALASELAVWDAL